MIITSALQRVIGLVKLFCTATQLCLLSSWVLFNRCFFVGVGWSYFFVSFHFRLLLLNIFFLFSHVLMSVDNRSLRMRNQTEKCGFILFKNQAIQGSGCGPGIFYQQSTRTVERMKTFLLLFVSLWSNQGISLNSSFLIYKMPHRIAVKVKKDNIHKASQSCCQNEIRSLIKST